MIRHTIAVILMRTQEVVVCDPQGDIIVGSFLVIITTGDPVAGFEGTVQTFHKLLEWAEFGSYFIIVRQTDDLGDAETEVFTIFLQELHGSKDIGRVTISDELEVFRELCKVTECFSHGKNAWSYCTVQGYLIAKDGTGYGIRDEPDIGFYAADFDISLISDHGVGSLIIVVIHERLDDSG